jgi:hypothetical protein
MSSVEIKLCRRCNRSLITGQPGIEVVYSAIKNGELACLKYLDANGFAEGVKQDVLIAACSEHGDLACLKYLCENGYPMPCYGLAEFVHIKSSKTLDLFRYSLSLSERWGGFCNWGDTTRLMKKHYTKQAAVELAFEMYSKVCSYSQFYINLAGSPPPTIECMTEALLVSGMLDLDHPSWRSFIDKENVDVMGSEKFKRVILHKREELSEIRRVVSETVPLCQDIIKYVLLGYF